MVYVIIKPYTADGRDCSDTYCLSTEEALECPFCFTQIEVQPLRGIYWEKKESVQIFLKCKKCNNTFVGYTKYNNDSGELEIVSLSKGNHKKRKFQKEIEELSPDFVKIYGEAEFAEQENLGEICGVGYRKGLEFVIKDYLIIHKKFN